MPDSIPNFLQGLEKKSFLSEDNVPIISSVTPLGEIKFWGYGQTSEFRVRTLLSKEPETINWINSFDVGSTFWDVGANIGGYSLYASLVGNTRVMSFEPSSFNYFLLNKNIYLNQKDNNISAYNIAFSNKNTLDILYLSSVECGNAQNTFSFKTDAYGKEMDPVFQHHCLGFTIDNFIQQYNIEHPNYLKIDVDGIESLILKGAKATLSNRLLKSVLVEVNENETSEVAEICSYMEESGFCRIVKRHSPYYDNSYYKPLFNYIFYRD